MQRTLITPRLPNVWSASKEKPKVPSIIIPRAPNHASSLIDYDKVVPTTKVPLRTEPTPHSLTVPLSPASSTSTSSQSSYVDGSVPDVLAIADLFATLKRTVSTLHSTFDSLGMQTEKMANLAPAIQADQQLEHARSSLEQQILRHEKAMDDVKAVLQHAICDSVVERLKAQIYDAIHENIAKEVESRVQQALARQIPERLRQQVQNHSREMLEVQTTFFNAETCPRNATLQSPCMNIEPLRPLLRPLPSALQSPAYVFKQPFTTDNSTVVSPVSAFPAAPLPTPMASRVPAIIFPPGSKQVFELVPPTPSPLFPRDMRSLFALGPDVAKRLLNDYGLESTSLAPSPLNTCAPQTRLMTHTGLNTPDTSPILESRGTREDDFNKFMTHIGVPYLMVPVPKPKLGPQLHIVIP